MTNNTTYTDPIEGFPKTQAEMAEWKKKYHFDIGTKKWYGGKGVPDTLIAPDEDLGEMKISDLPGEEPDTASFSLIKSMREYTDWLTKDQERIRKEREEEQERITKEKTEKKTWMEKFFGETKEEKRATEYEELGIKPKEYIAKRITETAEVEDLYNQYNAAVARKEAEVAAIETRPGIDVEFMSRESAAIQKRHNVKLSQMAAGIKTKLAIMEMKEGDFDKARSLVTEAVNDYTFDKALAYDEMEKWEEENEDILAGLDKEYQDIWKEVKASKLTEIEEAKKNTAFALETLIDAADKGVYLDPAELLKMTKEEITKLYAKKVAPVIAARETRKAKEAENWADFLSKSQRLWLENQGIDVDTPEGVEEGKTALQLKIPDSIQNKALTEGIPTAFGSDKINIVQAIWEGIATNGDEITKQQLIDTYGDDGKNWWDTWTRIMREEVELEDWASILGLEGAATTEAY